MIADAVSQFRLELQLSFFLSSSDLHALLCCAYRNYEEDRRGSLPELERAQILDAIRGVIVMTGFHQSAVWDDGLDLSTWAWRLVERHFPELL